MFRFNELQKGFMSEKFLFGFFWVHCDGESSKTKFLFLIIFSWSFYIDLRKPFMFKFSENNTFIDIEIPFLFFGLLISKNKFI